jgi:hypothetical protein
MDRNPFTRTLSLRERERASVDAMSRLQSIKLYPNPNPTSFSRWDNQPDEGWSMTPPT